MNKYDLMGAMTENHQRFSNYMNMLSKTEYLYAAPGKWSAGQQLDHIILCTKPLILAFRIPKFALKLIFGKLNRPSMSFEELVQKYEAKIAGGSKATESYIPSIIGFEQKNSLISQLELNIKKINAAVEKFEEEDLDGYLLPHPLLGKITCREMLYFTIDHVDHHHYLMDKAIQEGLKKGI